MSTKKKKTTDNTFILPNVLSLGAAEQLRESFVQRLVVGSDIIVDASNVDAITTPCLQVIISAGNTFEEAGCNLSIGNPSPAFTNAFNDLGFSELFEKWSVK